jgi:predicted dehydrogenase
MDKENTQNNSTGKPKGNSSISRRDIIKGLATVPVLGALAYSAYRKKKHDLEVINNLANEIGTLGELPSLDASSSGKRIRLGVIGFGLRGGQLLTAAGLNHPDAVDSLQRNALATGNDSRLQQFMESDDLNIEIKGVCDIFSVYAERAQLTGANVNKVGTGGKLGDLPVIYKNYKEMLAAPDIDAVIIATPDHWHAPMSIDAARSGKHVYCEKPFSWSVPETYTARQAVKESGVVFQLGHQNRWVEATRKAKLALEKNLLGQIDLIEVTTNRNDANGAWVYPIHKDASPETIDWNQFIGQAPWHEFSLERFFRWRCWWDYSTGISGDLLTHEYDVLNDLLDLGIPDSAVSSGGIYWFKDGRTVPDVLTTAFEFTDRNLSVLYSATLANSRNRGKIIMGHDGTMLLGNTMTIYADSGSTRYAEKILSGDIKTTSPIINFIPGKKSIDAVTTATEAYFVERGLLYTQSGGKIVNTVSLHLKNWLNCIRNGGTPVCNIDQAFEEGITAHMGTISYREGRRVYWNRENEKIV